MSEKSLKDLRFEKYKPLLDFYATLYKTENLDKNFGFLDKVRIDDISNNFHSFSEEKKKDFFNLAQHNPRILLALLLQHDITSKEIESLLSAPVLSKEIAAIVAQREDTTQEIIDMLKVLLGEKTIANLYAEVWFNTSDNPPECPFSQAMNSTYLKSYESCKEKSLIPLMVADRDLYIETYCEMRGWNLTEEEATAICNNVYISDELRNNAFKIGADFEEIYHKTEFMKEEMEASYFDAIFTFIPESKEDEEIQDETNANLGNLINEGEISEDMMKKIADKTIHRININEKEEDVERLRKIYNVTKSPDTLDTYRRIINPSIDIKEAVCKNEYTNKVIVDVIVDDLCNKLKKKVYGRKVENEMVGTITDCIYTSQLSQGTYNKILDLGYLEHFKAIAEAKLVPDVIKLNLIKMNKDCVNLYNDTANIHIALKNRNVNPNLAEAIVSNIQMPKTFQKLMLPESEVEKITTAFNDVKEKVSSLKKEMISIVVSLKQNVRKLENIKESGLFYMGRNDDSDFKEYVPEPMMGAVRNISLTPEQLSEKLEMLDKDSIDLYLKTLVDNLHRDVIMKPDTLGFLNASTLEVINAYNHIDYYNDIYTKFIQAQELIKDKDSKEKETENVIDDLEER